MNSQIFSAKLLFLFLILLIQTTCLPKALYVDSALISDCLGHYSVQDRKCIDGAGADAYVKIQSAINVMRPGDTLFLRGGTYKEMNIYIGDLRSGSRNAWYTICSYRDAKTMKYEWAKIDGKYDMNNANSQTYNGYIFRGTTVNGAQGYIRFERFEITGGGLDTNNAGYPSSMGGGLKMRGGPFEFRYLYIHNNYGNVSENNGGLILENGTGGTLIENCYFKANGDVKKDKSTSSANLMIFADYSYENAISAIDTTTGFYKTTVKNTIRYNIFDGDAGNGYYTVLGFKQKGMQRLTGYNYVDTKNSLDKEPNDNRYQSYGDKIHHNIFLNHEVGIEVDQDYVQIHHNIILMRATGVPFADANAIQLRDQNANRRGPYDPCVYNNTLICNGKRGLMYHPVPQGWSGGVPLAECWIQNNLIDGAAHSGYNTGQLTISSDNVKSAGYPLDSLHVDRNCFYRSSPDSLIYIDNKYYSRSMAASSLDMVFSVNSSQNIYKTASTTTKAIYTLQNLDLSKYKLLGAFKLDSNNTIANGGIGGKHPYLTDADPMPIYIGATDPSKETTWIDSLILLPNKLRQPQPPTVIITGESPKIYNAGSIAEIKWTVDSDEKVDSCKVDISLDGGKTFKFTKIAKDSRSIQWAVPDTTINDGLIKITAYNSIGQTGSSNCKFSIIKILHKLSLFVFPIDEQKVEIGWSGKVEDTLSFNHIALCFRKDHYANSPEESGLDTVVELPLLPCRKIIQLSRSSQKYYITISTRKSDGAWSAPHDRNSVYLSSRSAISGQSIADSILVTSDTAFHYSAVACKGGASLHEIPIISTKLIDETKRLIVITTPDSLVSGCFGYQTFFTVSTQNYSETFNLSRSVQLNEYSCDDQKTLDSAWTPLWTTHILKDHTIPSVLSKSSQSDNGWKYDKQFIRLIRWYPYSGNKSKPDKYIEYGSADDSLFSILPGRLLWVKTKDEIPITLSSSTTVNLRDNFSIQLVGKEWTDLSIPFRFPIQMNDILEINDIADSISVYEWEKSGRTYVTKSLYLPGFSETNGGSISIGGNNQKVYSIFYEKNGTYNFNIPPVSSSNSLNKLNKSYNKNNRIKYGKITFKDADGNTLNSVYCGISETYGPRYYSLGPTTSTTRISLYDRDQNRDYGHLITRTDAENGNVFELKIENQSGKIDTVHAFIEDSYGLSDSLVIGLYNSSKSESREMEIVVPANSASYIYAGIANSQTTILNTLMKTKKAEINIHQKYGNLSIELNTNKDSKLVDIQVFNLLGRTVLKKSVGLLSNGHCYIKTWDNKAKQLRRGRYFVKVSLYDNDHRLSKVAMQSVILY